MSKLRVAVIGCGLIGRRRAQCAARHAETEVAVVADSNEAAAKALASDVSSAFTTDWREAVLQNDVGAVVVSTPNALLHDVATHALQTGRHALIEKPMCRNLEEARSLARTAKDSGKVLKIGFNHRYHPALSALKRLAAGGSLGAIINARARYGHGGRAGYELEWRGNARLAGGGELTDQGVHILDLFNWIIGAPTDAFSCLQTAVWPIGPLEDSAFGLLRFKGGAIASMHTSWTQWQNLFSFETFFERGSATVDGLGGSYGTEQLTTARRRPEGGVPVIDVISFPGEDQSWALEWADFVNGATHGAEYLGTPAEGLKVMETLNALYQSAAQNRVVKLSER